MVRNRRQRFCDTVLAESDYFSESEMRRRDPAGWAHFVGTSSTNESSGAAEGLGGFFMSAMEKQEQRLREAAQEMAEREKERRFGWRDDGGEEEEGGGGEEREGVEAWRAWHRMRFVAGEDEEFDYAAVDDNDKWDDWKTAERDAQEAWFDGGDE